MLVLHFILINYSCCLKKKKNSCCPFGKKKKKTTLAVFYELLIKYSSAQIERERNLLNTKLIEFDKLCKPQGALLKPNHSSQNPFPSASQNAFLQAANNSAAPSLSSFSQLGTSLNTGFGPRQVSLLIFRLLC